MGKGEAKRIGGFLTIVDILFDRKRIPIWEQFTAIVNQNVFLGGFFWFHLHWLFMRLLGIIHLASSQIFKCNICYRYKHVEHEEF